jgi:predicted amidohydrolase
MRTIRVALVQFDARPEEPARNLEAMTQWAAKAAKASARWIMFHEGTLCDYTPRVAEFAEPVPDGNATQAMIRLAQEHHCHISFGLSESDHGKCVIS